MEDKKTEKKQKSTILLLLVLFFIFNAGLIFKAGLNTLYFTEDTSADYAPVQATLKELRPDSTIEPGEEPRIIPVFSFMFKGEETTLEAPLLSFSQTQSKQPFTVGEELDLWVQKYRGELILPPKSSQKEIGRSQMVISVVFLLLAIMIWMLRNRLGRNAKQ